MMPGTSPVRKILRARRVMGRAADLLDQLALTIQECEVVDGYWPVGSEEARSACLEAQSVALALRVMLSSPSGELPHVA